MSYKADYGPASLLCPDTYKWVRIDEKCKKIIDENREIARLAPQDAKICDDMDLAKVNVEAIVREKVKLLIAG